MVVRVPSEAVRGVIGHGDSSLLTASNIKVIPSILLHTVKTHTKMRLSSARHADTALLRRVGLL